MDTAGVIGTVLAALAGLAATLVTRRNAKDTTAVGGFTELTRGLQHELERQTSRTTAAIARIDHLERVNDRRRRLARRHEEWDALAVGQLRQLGAEIPDPPPLDTWED